MSRSRRRTLPSEPQTCVIEALSPDGRGLVHEGDRLCLVDGALPGETVLARVVSRRRNEDALKTLEVISPAAERQTPPCAHADLCGACSLQHMNTEAQLRFKEQILRTHFAGYGDLGPEQWAEPMHAEGLGYRRKARLGVRYVPKRESVLVGFREKRNNFMTDIASCAVLDPRVGERIMDLRELIYSLDACQTIAQVEVACGDDEVALVFRHMMPLSDADKAALTAFGQARDLQIYLQPGGEETVHRIWPEGGVERLSYQLTDDDLTLTFHPMDFIQVHAGINQRMVSRALEWLDPGPGERVLDLFCGLGNFTLPLARRAGQVTGVEGDEAMVVRGRENARLNGVENVVFHGADLQGDFTSAGWAAEGFDKILIDPPRSGAEEVCRHLTAFGAGRIVYVSCNPATLARDARVIVDKGYRLVKAGIMDMFPHTTHVESIALFERR